MGADVRLGQYAPCQNGSLESKKLRVEQWCDGALSTLDTEDMCVPRNKHWN